MDRYRASRVLRPASAFRLPTVWGQRTIPFIDLGGRIFRPSHRSGLPLDRKLWEIDENLIRAELTELERGEHLARRKDIYIARHPETRQGGDPVIAGGGKAKNDNLSSFAKDTASKVGVNERTIERSVRRAELICGKAKELIRGTEAEDSGVELDALVAMKPYAHRRASPRIGPLSNQGSAAPRTSILKSRATSGS
jgi:hypothetical protein